MKVYFDPIDHSYTSEYGQEFVPVTKICQITPRAVDFSTLPRHEAVRLSAERGTMIHEEVQTLIENGEMGISKVCEWVAKSLIPLFTDFESEVLVYSDDEATPFAGQIDIVCRNKERYLLIDLKNGGHHTVDYQESLYKRGFCKNRGIDPSLVDLACIDASDEDNIKFFQVRTIEDSWLNELLKCYAEGIPYSEPLPKLKGIDDSLLNKLSSVESYITTIEETLTKLTDERDSYREKLFNAMEEALVDTFEFGSLKITRVKPTTQESFDSKKFKADHKDLFEQYKKTIRKKGYLLVTVRDVTQKET